MKTVAFPTYPWPAGRGRLFGRYSIDMPMSLLKLGGEWISTAFPHQDLLASAENYYLGGYHYELTDEQAADLPAEWVAES